MEKIKPYYLLVIIPFIVTSVANISLESDTYQIFFTKSDMVLFSKFDIYVLWSILLSLPTLLHYALAVSKKGIEKYKNLHIVLSCIFCALLMLVFSNYPLMPSTYNEMVFENPFTNRIQLYINTSVYALAAFIILQLVFVVYALTKLIGNFQKKNIVLG